MLTNEVKNAQSSGYGRMRDARATANAQSAFQSPVDKYDSAQKGMVGMIYAKRLPFRTS